MHIFYKIHYRLTPNNPDGNKIKVYATNHLDLQLKDNININSQHKLNVRVCIISLFSNEACKVEDLTN